MSCSEQSHQHSCFPIWCMAEEQADSFCSVGNLRLEQVWSIERNSKNTTILSLCSVVV